MNITERFRTPVADTCREVIDADHPPSVEAVGGRENLLFEVHCSPGDAGLILGAPGRPWPDPHSHTRVAAVCKGGMPRQAAVTRVGFNADASARAGEAVPHG